MDNTKLATVIADMVDVNNEAMAVLAAWAEEHEAYIGEDLAVFLMAATALQASSQLIKVMGENNMEVYDRLGKIGGFQEQLKWERKLEEDLTEDHDEN